MTTRPVIASQAKQSTKWIERAFLALLAVPFIIYGSAKPPQSTIDFLRTDADIQYFYDRGSYVTNDYVYVDFTTQVVPASANFYGEYAILTKPATNIVTTVTSNLVYKQVEYLQSSGNQWIDTRVNAASGCSANMKMSWVFVPGDATFFGARTSSTRFYLLHYYGGFTLGYGNYNNTGGNASKDVLYEIETELFTGAQKMTINGAQKIAQTDASELDINLPIHLFGCNNSGSSVYRCSARAYAVEMFEDEGASLVRDFIPVLDPTGKPAMFDRVESKFYYNQGTGADFTYGAVTNEVYDIVETVTTNVTYEVLAPEDLQWEEFVNTTIEDFAPPQSIAFDSATNYCFRFYTDWTPGPAVVTNGVLKINWGVPITPQAPDTVIGLPVQTEIELLEE